jgi:outer membrane protein assembly factor BamA
VNESTVFRDFGPVAGQTFKISYDGSPSFGDSWISRNTLDVDYRHYSRIAANGVLATRVKGFKSWGRNPDFTYFGGNSELRGYEYLEFIGQKGFFANAELRFPLIDAMLTPIGVLGGLRGVFFANIGGAGANNQPFKLLSRNDDVVAPITGYDIDAFGQLTPTYGAPQPITGIRLIDARASYGIGLQSFLLGFPMHFDWSWKTLFNKTYEDQLFRSCTQTTISRVECGPDGGSFRNVKFDFWIGYDF